MLSGQAAGQRSHLDRAVLRLPLSTEEHPRARQGPGVWGPLWEPQSTPTLCLLPSGTCKYNLHKMSVLFSYFR